LWCHLQALTKLKITVVFFQISVQLPSILTIKFPKIYLSFLSFFSFVNLDILSLFDFGCVVQVRGGVEG
jgi:hypothetical protein